jgi:hypothetical protein
MGNYFASWAYNVPAAARELPEPTAVADDAPDDDDDDGTAASLGRVRQGLGTAPPPPTPRRTLPKPSDDSIQMYMALAEPYAQITQSKPTQNVAAVYRHWKEDDDVMDFYRDLRLMWYQLTFVILPDTMLLKSIWPNPFPDDVCHAFGRFSPFSHDSLVVPTPFHLDHCVLLSRNGKTRCMRGLPHACDVAK